MTTTRISPKIQGKIRAAMSLKRLQEPDMIYANLLFQALVLLEKINRIVPLHTAFIAPDCMDPELTHVNIGGGAGYRILLTIDPNDGTLTTVVGDKDTKEFTFTDANILGWTSLHYDKIKRDGPVVGTFPSSLLRNRLPTDLWFKQNEHVYLSQPLGVDSVLDKDRASNPKFPRRRLKVFFDKGQKAWTWATVAANGRSLSRDDTKMYQRDRLALRAATDHALRHHILPGHDITPPYLLGIKVIWQYEATSLDSTTTIISLLVSDGTKTTIRRSGDGNIELTLRPPGTAVQVDVQDGPLHLAVTEALINLPHNNRPPGIDPISRAVRAPAPAPAFVPPPLGIMPP